MNILKLLRKALELSIEENQKSMAYTYLASQRLREIIDWHNFEIGNVYIRDLNQIEHLESLEELTNDEKSTLHYLKLRTKRFRNKYGSLKEFDKRL